VKHVKNRPVVGKGLRFETELPLSGQWGFSLIKGPAFHDPRERGPNAGGLLNSQTMQKKKAEMVLHLVFREPAEILYATTTPFCPPPTSHSPNQVMCDVPTGSKRGLSSTLTLHRFVSWEARLPGHSVGTALEAVGEAIDRRFRRPPCQDGYIQSLARKAIKQ
jgi:hypothetical protein